MKKIVFILAVGSLIISGPPSSKQPEKRINMPTQKKVRFAPDAIDKIIKDYIAEMNPTPDRCRPPRQTSASGVVETREVAPPTLEFACMLNGFKNVWLGSDQDLDIPHLHEILAYKNMNYLAVPGSISPQIILFTPEGKINAYLFLYHHLSGGPGRSYADGYCLGYSDGDIEAFYTINGIDSFQSDKSAFLKWLETHRAGIEDWARKYYTAQDLEPFSRDTTPVSTASPA